MSKHDPAHAIEQNFIFVLVKLYQHTMKKQAKNLTLVLIFLLGMGLQVVTSCRSHSGAVARQAGTKSVMKKVADWQINNFEYASSGNLHDYGIDAWTNATLYLGMLEWAKIANDSTYYHWLVKIGSANDWHIPSNFSQYPKYQIYHADELCMGQFYLGLFDIYRKEDMLASTKARVDWIMKNPPDSTMDISNKQSWTWCDALFMAPPVYACLAEIENDVRYLQFMDREYKRTYNFLCDKENNLFFRDSNYLVKRETNGEKVFWGRGNGWVAAGLVNLLKLLPEDSVYRPFYENLFKNFVPRLASLQGNDGFWHASLLDPDNYPAPETSATALITYALAYGINHGLLERAKFAPVMEKSWAALLSAVDEDGKLGWVQPIGADPRTVTAEMTAPYGVGAFLLAGSEVNTYYTYYFNF
jgi:rhamnogalacturonyl hydrolase YesR